MNKTIGASIAVLVLIGCGYFYLNMQKPETPAQSVAQGDYKNVAYTIESQRVQLVDGTSDVPAVPGGAERTTTVYFGNVGKGDLNGDGIPDLAFILVQKTGGSGTFYYVVAALQNADGSYTGTNGIAIGDRIAPQTTEINHGQIFVNYAERKPDEPMTTQPSVGMTKVLKVTGTQLVESAGPTSLGTYTYECDEHVTFTMSPAYEMTSIRIEPQKGGAYPPKSTLLPVAPPAGKTGKWFSDGVLIFSGKGESVTITSKGSSPLNCSPVKDANSAPWNWGD